jgi:nucleotide-binding universal stress UspA family protein
MFERMVLAVDGSEPADRATRVAAELAAQLGSEVVVVHIDPIVAAWNLAMEAESASEASEIADSAVRMLKDSGVSARSEVRFAARGFIAPEILSIAAHEDAGLIVMGTRGLGEVSGMLFGSVTHRVLHDATIPVLVVK